MHVRCPRPGLPPRPCGGVTAWTSGDISTCAVRAVAGGTNQTRWVVQRGQMSYLRIATDIAWCACYLAERQPDLRCCRQQRFALSNLRRHPALVDSVGADWVPGLRRPERRKRLFAEKAPSLPLFFSSRPVYTVARGGRTGQVGDGPGVSARGLQKMRLRVVHS